MKIRVDQKKKNFFFDFIDYPTDKHIDGKSDNKGTGSSKKIFIEKKKFSNFFFFDSIDYPTEVVTLTLFS